MAIFLNYFYMSMFYATEECIVEKTIVKNNFLSKTSVDVFIFIKMQFYKIKIFQNNVTL